MLLSKVVGLPNLPSIFNGELVDFELTDAVAGEAMWVILERHHFQSGYMHLHPLFICFMAAVRQHLHAPSNITESACATILKADDTWSIKRFGVREQNLMETLMQCADYFVIGFKSFWIEPDAGAERLAHWKILANLLGSDTVAAQTFVAIGYKLGLIKPL